MTACSLNPIARPWAALLAEAWRAGRPRRVTTLLLLVVILSAVDLALTLGFMTSSGGLLEDNPIVRWLVEHTQSGLALTAWKLITVGFSVGLLHRLRVHRQAELASWLLAALMVWLTLRWGDYIEVVASLEPAQMLHGATAIG